MLTLRRMCAPYLLLAILFAVLAPFAHTQAAVQPPATPSKAGAPRKAVPPAAPTAGKHFVYKTVAGRELSLWVVEPPASAGAGPHPAIVFYHGGGWQIGSLSEFNRQATYLAGRGIVTIQVEYRLIDNPITTPITPCVMDAKSAMRYVRAHAAELGIDPKRIAAAGSSAGAQLAGFLGMIDGSDDPADDLKVSAKADMMILLSAAVDVHTCCHGHGSPNAGAFSPTDYVRAGLPPMLVLESSVDQTVPPAMVQKFVDAMKAAGNDVTLTWFPEGGHGFFHNGPDFYVSLEDMDKFLAAHGWLTGPPNEAAIRALPAREGAGDALDKQP